MHIIIIILKDILLGSFLDINLNVNQGGVFPLCYNNIHQKRFTKCDISILSMKRR